MKIEDIINTLERIAPLSYQENYDNAGLITGHKNTECTGIICALDATEVVITEAAKQGCNLVVAHHPIIFNGLKKINGKNYVEKAVIASIKNEVAIYATHTNLDNVASGVNKQIEDKLGLINCRILVPKQRALMKLYTFAPINYGEKIRCAIFNAGGGEIGNYSECSFNAEGTGTFKGDIGTTPFVGEPGMRHEEKEIKIEVIFPAYLKSNILSAMIKAHPYEEVAFDVINLANEFQNVGSGLIGELPEEIDEEKFLQKIKEAFKLSVIRHTNLLGKPVNKIALCGGAGSFLIDNAIEAGADFFITSDIKYYEFFDSNNKLVIADIGHWESEQYTIDLIVDILKLEFPTFAVRKTEVKTNPVNYFV